MTRALARGSSFRVGTLAWRQIEDQKATVISQLLLRFIDCSPLLQLGKQFSEVDRLSEDQVEGFAFEGFKTRVQPSDALTSLPSPNGAKNLLWPGNHYACIDA